MTPDILDENDAKLNDVGVDNLSKDRQELGLGLSFSLSKSDQ